MPVLADWILAVAIATLVCATATTVLAWTQWRLAGRAERARRDELARAEQRAVDAAYASVHAEWFRTWAVATQWREGDLVEWAMAGQLDPDDIVPPDWGSLAGQLGRLRYMAAYLGSFGVALSYEAARVARTLQRDAREYAAHRPGAEPDRTAYESRLLPHLRTLEARAKELAMEAADLLEDALAHAPADVSADARGRSVKFNQRLHSRRARELADRAARAERAGAAERDGRRAAAITNSAREE